MTVPLLMLIAMTYNELNEEYRRLQALYLEYPSDEVLLAMQDIEAKIKEIEAKEPNHHTRCIFGDYIIDHEDICLN